MAHSVDIHVGKRLRHRRWLIGMTQGELAQELGVRFQQVQKYESGTNRVSASRLWEMAQALDVPISYFFQGLHPDDPVQDGETQQAENLVRFYRSMPNAERQKQRETASVMQGSVAVPP